MSSRLERLGRTAVRHRRRFLAAWCAVALGILTVAIAAGGSEIDTFSLPGSESQKALDLLKARFPSQSGDTATVVFAARGSAASLHDPGAQDAIVQTVQNLERLPHATQVIGPVGPLADSLVSKNGKIGFATVQYDESALELGKEAFASLEAAARPARAAGLEVAFGGAVTDYANAAGSGDGDVIGLAFAVVVLLFAFGSVIAMGLPIGTALFGLLVGISGITLLAAVTEIGTVAPVLGTMIGLGVGIDYSLFIVTRYRQNLADGQDVETAVGNALATAGTAVLFAGTTVVIALCGLLLADIPYVTRLGFSASLVVAVMMAAALTLLPALLGFAGTSVDRWRVPGLHLGHHHKGSEAERSHGWARWAETVAGRPWPFAIASVLLLAFLAYPVLHMRLGEVDDGDAPVGSTQRIAFDLLAAGFGPGVNGPLIVAVALPHGDTSPAVTLSAAITTTRGVATVAPPQFSPKNDAAVISVVPKSAPDAVATSELVDRLRSSVVPRALSGTGARAYVGGLTAAYLDIGDRIGERLPYFIGAVVLLSVMLLVLVFHSIVVPLTAGLMNLLSVGAAYGVVVAVFQWGWLKGLVGLASTVPIVAFVPMMMFAILFGLSMDYQVFLLTRVREEYAKASDNRQSVVTGLATTARVITSAALIMIVVFLSFVTSPSAEVKMFGLGLAVAVFVDATVVRMVLVPALMEILGTANWWFPKHADRFVPRLEVAEVTGWSTAGWRDSTRR